MPKLIIRLLRQLESLRLIRRDGEAVPEQPKPVVGIAAEVMPRYMTAAEARRLEDA